MILGDDFESSIIIVKWLSMIPLLKTLHYFAADTITGAGYQGIRSAIQILTAVISCALNFWMIPIYSWLGAVYSGIASNLILCLLLWGSVAILIKKEKQEKIYVAQ